MKYMYLGTKLIIWKLSFSHLDALLMLSTGKMYLSVFVFHRVHIGGGRHLLSSRAPHNLHLDCPSIIQGKSKQCRTVFPPRDQGKFSHQIFLKHRRISRSNRPERRMLSSFSSVPKQNEGQPLSHPRHELISGVSTTPPQRLQRVEPFITTEKMQWLFGEMVQRMEVALQWAMERCQMVGWVTSRHKTQGSVRRSTSLGFILRQRWWCRTSFISPLHSTLTQKLHLICFICFLI